MNIWEYQDELISEAQKFATWWKEQHAMNPEMFPLSMDDGEWDEQFRLWQNGE